MARITSLALPSRFSSSSRYCLRSTGLLRHAGLHGGLRHRRRLPDQHARIERLGNDVLAPELQAVDRIGAQHAESGTSSLASAASARVAASFISSLMVVARTSSAPRKMNGKPRTLFTWLG